MNAKLRLAVPALGAAILAASCGTGGDNDQGIVFRAVGIYRGPASIEGGRITCTEPTVQNAIVDTAFTLDVEEVVDFPNRSDPAADPCGGYVALENGLAAEAINLQEISIRYEIPGTAIPVPDHSVSIGQRILPAASDQPTTSGRANLIYAELVGQLLPRTIIVFLNRNASALPAPPYLLNAFLVARGQSDTGETHATNEIGYTFTITS